MSQKLFLSQQESCCCIKLSNAQNVLVEKTLSTVFFNLFLNWNQLPKICHHDWKELLEIANIAVFESDLFVVETNDDIASQTGGIFTEVGVHTNRDFVEIVEGSIEEILKFDQLCKSYWAVLTFP